MRKTKIICTIGPASKNEETLSRLIENGMDVARLNLSHGDHETHKQAIDMIKVLRERYGRHVAILLDVEGPKVRVNTLKGGKAELITGALFTLKQKRCEGDETQASVTYPGLAKMLKKGNRVLLDDGAIELAVEEIKEEDVVCRVVNGGFLKDHKSVNLPGVDLEFEYVNEKDRADILFGIENDVDFIAASFCRSAADIMDIRRVLGKNEGNRVLVIAKIENHKGVENIDEILKVSDGIMVARGDMGVEMDMVDVPRIQKSLIKRCLSAGKVVITATQMLDSMIVNPRPTRAEATDIANSIYDGTSAMMLSGETAVGKYPVESLMTMSRIAVGTEADIDYKKRFNNLLPDTSVNVTGALSHATCLAAHSLGASAIIAVTKSGMTARMISKYRPAVPIVACSPSMKTCNQLALSWGVYPIVTEEKGSTDALFDHVMVKAQNAGFVQLGEVAAITAGVPIGISGTTNTLKIQIAGNMIVKGEGINGMVVSGRLCVAKDAEQARAEFKPGDIIVMPDTEDSMTDILEKAAGIIAERGGEDSNAAMAGLTLGIPVLYGAANATKILKHGMTVTLDTTRGMVYTGAPVKKAQSDG